MNLLLSSSSFSSVSSRVGSGHSCSISMQMHFKNRVISFSACNHFFTRQVQNLPQTLEMVTESGQTKRPMCPTCSKPTRFCLCTRLKTPCLENSIAVTILQHSLEKNHPLNSTRIASIGLKNLSVISVSDVNYEAEFVIQFLNSNLENLSCAHSSLSMLHLCRVLLKDTNFRESDRHPLIFLPSPSNIGENSSINIKDSNFDSNAAVSFTIEKYGAICLFPNQDSNKPWNSSLSSDPAYSRSFSAPGCPLLASRNQDLDKPWKQSVAEMQGKSLCSGLSQEQADSVSCSALGCRLLAPRAATDDIRKGFLVKKIQRKLLDGSSEFQELKEFEVSVPPGSVLLFPSEDSIGTEEIDFEVKNLIVLDGTWAKAKRMYNENPWLKTLPHLRLDVEKLSLYSEVRRQPKAGYLSTIESIVYALKAVGEKDSKGLDHLLDVFESMVVDQRRCKDEGMRQRLSNCDKFK